MLTMTIIFCLNLVLYYL